MGRITGVAEVALRVIDLDKMIDFYREMLGFEPQIVESDHAFLKIADLDSPLGASDHPQLLALFARQKDISTERSTFDHIAFEIPAESYQEEYKRFEALGMVLRERVWPETLLWRGRSFFFYDPEGNVIELIAGQPEM